MKKIIVLAAAFTLIACDKRPYSERLQAHDAEEKVEFESQLKEGTKKIEVTLKQENKRRIDIFNKCFQENKDADTCLTQARKIETRCDDGDCWTVGGEEDEKEKQQIENLGGIKGAHLVKNLNACKEATSEERCEELAQKANRGYIERYHTNRWFNADNAWYLLNGKNSSVYYPNKDGHLERLHGTGPEKLELSRAQSDHLLRIKR